MTDKLNTLNPAALSALAKGDVSNFLTAATPGGIEAQEKAGQSAFTESFKMLPRRGMVQYRSAMERFGFKIGKNEDDLFVEVTPPNGWTLRPSDHSMWSYIYDDQGRKRGEVFYKAAFYDRCAHFSLQPRYYVGSAYRGDDRYSVVRDGATDQVLFEVGPFDKSDDDDYDEKCGAYADEHFPDWRNVEAYW